MEKEQKRPTQSHPRSAVPGFVCIFFSAFFAFLFCCLVVCRLSLLNQNYYVKAIQNTDYCKLLTDEISAEFVKTGRLFTDVPDPVFESSVSFGTVLNDSLAYCETCFLDIPKAPDTSALEAELAESVTAYLKANATDLDWTAEVEESIRFLAENCGEIYQKNITVPGLRQIGAVASRYGILLDVCICASLVLAIVSALLLLPLYRSKRRRLRYLVMSTSTLLVMVAVIPLFLLLTQAARRVSISSKSLYTLVSAVLSGVADKFLWIGLYVLILLCLFIAALILYQRHRARHEYRYMRK